MPPRRWIWVEFPSELLCTRHAALAETNLDYVGSVPASDCADLLTLPATARSIVDTDRFGRLRLRHPPRWR